MQKQIVEVDDEIHNSNKINENDEFEQFVEVEEHFVSDNDDSALSKKRHSARNIDVPNVPNSNDDSQDGKQNSKHK